VAFKGHMVVVVSDDLPASLYRWLLVIFCIRGDCCDYSWSSDTIDMLKHNDNLRWTVGYLPSQLIRNSLLTSPKSSTHTISAKQGSPTLAPLDR
jgi:hypothetical protein